MVLCGGRDLQIAELKGQPGEGVEIVDIKGKLGLNKMENK